MPLKTRVSAAAVGLVTTWRLTVQGLQVVPEVAPVEVVAQVEVRNQVVVIATKFATISSLGTVTGDPVVFVATSVPAVGETAPSLPVPATAVSQQLPEQLDQLPALNVRFWADNLPKVYDSDKSSSLLVDLVEGVRIGRPPADTQIVSVNWPSAVEHRVQVSKIIADDLGAGRLHGPFRAPPYENCIISPLGAFKKRGSSKIRLIHDLSYPLKGSVNASIKKEEFSLAYSSVDDAVRICKRLSPGPVFMAKLRSSMSWSTKRTGISWASPGQTSRVGPSTTSLKFSTLGSVLPHSCLTSSRRHSSNSCTTWACPGQWSDT